MELLQIKVYHFSSITTDRGLSLLAFCTLEFVTRLADFSDVIFLRVS